MKPHDPSRRRLFKAAGATGLAAAIPLPAPAQPRPAYLFFNAREAAFVEAAVARLIPRDELGPGALEAGVPAFIDRQLAGAWGAGHARRQRAARAGLPELPRARRQRAAALHALPGRARPRVSARRAARLPQRRAPHRSERADELHRAPPFGSRHRGACRITGPGTIDSYTVQSFIHLKCCFKSLAEVPLAEGASVSGTFAFT